MRKYNIWRPIMLILVVFVTRSLVTTVCLLFGMTEESAGSIAMIAMIIAALIMYNRMMKATRRK
ncbi:MULTISPECIES: hypothetical protein [Paenibacillus]|uniref:hypothetical protein n=1 Tax=Paenibacillus TaxID=44249 RepID=UPI0004F914A9|nr:MULTISPECIES: hypothetical protein [Paenibacillus]AIQ50260.1 hypothetical protein R70331_00990 [Paenibacillus sp. FSL R7-0331]